MNTTETPLHHYPATIGLDLNATAPDAWELFFARTLKMAEQVRARRAAHQQSASAPVSQTEKSA